MNLVCLFFYFHLFTPTHCLWQYLKIVWSKKLKLFRLNEVLQPTQYFSSHVKTFFWICGDSILKQWSSAIRDMFLPPNVCLIEVLQPSQQYQGHVKLLILFLGRRRPPMLLYKPVFSAHTFHSNWQLFLPSLNQRKRENSRKNYFMIIRFDFCFMALQHILGHFERSHSP